MLCSALACAAALGFSLVQPKKYTANADLLFRDTQFDQELFGSKFMPATVDPARQAATDLDLASLETVAARAARVLDLPTQLVRSEVNVSAVGQANLVKVSVTDRNPSRAARIADTYAQQFIVFRRAADRATVESAETLVQRKLAALTAIQRLGSVGQSLQNRANELRILAALQTGNAELVQSAAPPTGPSSPRPVRNALLGLGLGLLLGLAMSFIVERLDRRVRNAPDLELLWGLPLLGIVPENERYSRASVDTLSASEAEPFALLRARLRYFNVDRDIRTLLVSSNAPGEGKSTIALNLAIAEVLAGVPRVLLVEADLRRPVFEERLRLERGPGLAEVLSRNSNLDSAVRHIPVAHPRSNTENETGLWLLTAGILPPNPAELLESKAMAEVLSKVTERFDFVVLDSPPTSFVSDAIPLLRLVSGVLLVSRIGVTTRDDVLHLRSQLINLRAPTLGVIANAVRPARRGYGASRYYSSGDYLADGAPGSVVLRTNRLGCVSAREDGGGKAVGARNLAESSVFG